MSKLWMVFSIFLLAGCTANPTQPIATAVENPTDLPTNVAVQMVPTNLPEPTLIPTEIGSGITLTPSSNAGDIHVRSGPMTSYPVAGTLKVGEKSGVIGMDPSGQWILIEFPSAPQRKAWVNAGLVNISGGIPPIVDPDSGIVITPTPSSEAGNPQAIAAIQQYLGQDAVEISYLGQSDNLNHPGQEVGRYHAGSDDFSVEVKTNHIVQIDIESGVGLTGAVKEYTPQELKPIAINLIASLAPHVNLASLTFHLDSKGEGKSIVYFFQWENTTIGSLAHPRIYAAYNIEGKLVGFINMLGIE
ncbi:MAG: SH3 domain-containing protein [Anaerolineaceae bacterium]|nr:SH3 domain-containing protein [Anaerolineaceae bacterium]